MEPTPLAEIALLAFDVDGVLTDGRIYVNEEGREMHAFHARDGLGMVLAGKRGLKLAAISGRPAPGVEARLVQLRVAEVHLGVKDKAQVLGELLQRLGLQPRQACFVGDDVNDLGAMDLAGLSFAPADAHRTVRARADRLTRARGGEGVVREIIELLLEARGTPLL